jgi:hypothetical protein
MSEKSNVTARTFFSFPFSPPKGTRILPQNGLNVLFHVEKGTEQDLLIALQQFSVDCSLRIAESIAKATAPKTTPPPPVEDTGEHTIGTIVTENDPGSVQQQNT